MEKSVLHICNYYAPYRGNFIESLEHLATGLKEKGTEQIYLFPVQAKSVAWVNEFKSSGREVYFQQDSFLKNVRLVKSIIKKHNVQTIFKHFSDSKIDLILSLFCRRKRIIRFFHCVYDPTRSSLKNRLLQILYKGSTLVGVSDDVSDKLKTAFPKCDVQTIRNAVCFDRLEKTDEFEKPDGISCHLMGYNFKVKGVDLAMKACAKLQKKYNIGLYLVLASHENEARNEIINEFGFFPDWIKLMPPKENIGTYYKGFDIFLLPSRSEGFPYAISEAVYCEQTVVASNIPTLNAYEFGSVYRFESGDADGLALSLEKAITELDEKREKRRLAKQQVVKEFDIGKWVDSVIVLAKV